MSDESLSLGEARDRAAAARVEFRTAAQDATGWFSPTRLKAEAAQAVSHQIGEAKATLRKSASNHPLITWSGLALVATGFTYVLRRPALALFHAGAGAVRKLRQRFARRK